jgi:iron(III) transport system substrate-binding protein
MAHSVRVARVLTIFVAALLVSAACGGGGGQTATSTNPVSATPVGTKPPSFDEAAETKKLYDAATAANETEVNWYSTVNEEEAKPLIDIWNKSFPKIKLNYIRASETALMSRILTEEQAGKHNFDTLSSTSANLLKSAGLSLKYLPPNTQVVDPDYIDKDGTWYAIYANWNVIQINTDKVKKGEIKTYEDIANAKWKGQVAIDATDYDWYDGLVATRGQQPTDDLLTKVRAATGVVIVDGHGNLNDAVVSGQYAIALNQFLNQVERSKRQGAPTEWIAIEPVIVQLGKIAISKSAPHPNAAKLLANFLISTDAQKYFATRGRQLARIDVPNDPPNLVAGLKKFPAPPLEGDALTTASKRFAAIFK